MKFLEWNNHIAKHFFNSDQAGKDIHLFITKQEIVNLAKEHFDEKSDKEIWDDFLRKLQQGLPGSGDFPDIFDKAVHAFQQWKRGLKSIEGVSLTYPPYISHLVFSVLPLIEIQGDYIASNYYDRLKDFLEENNIPQNLKHKLKVIDELWVNLSHWANDTRNGEWGRFKELSFRHNTRRFVYKPFSQCVLSPKAIKRLPNFFFVSGLTPKTFYQDKIFRQHLIGKAGVSILDLKPGVIEIIKKPQDEIGQSIIETVKSEFDQWTGEEHKIVLKDGEEKRIRTNTVVPIKLQFKITEDEEVYFSYRIKYSTEPPTGLKFGDFDDIYENENWSRTLNSEFKEFFEYKDTANKWIARFESKNLRLFIKGGYFLLGNSFWIETESLSRIEEMFLLCKDNIKDSIKKWGHDSCQEFQDCSNYSNLPTGYSLFRIKIPQKSHSQFEQLTVYVDKIISLRNGTGLKIAYRTYLNELLPEVEVSNANGSESVYLQYEDNSEKQILNKHPIIGGVWLLPDNLKLNSNFIVQIENEFIEGYRQTYRIEKPSIDGLSNEFVPKRNKFNSITSETDNHIQGNTIQLSTFKSTTADQMPFVSNSPATIHQKQFRFTDSLLLKWLIGIKECDILKYNEAFETVLRETFEGEQQHVQQRRKFSIHLLDYLGYVDYDYSTGKIYTLPPKLISIPTKNGRKALLIGARSEDLINEMVGYCLNNNQISISIKEQSEHNKNLLAPDSIIFQSNNRREFLNLSNHFQVDFDEWYILKLRSFLPTLSQYEQYIKSHGVSESYERYGLETKVFKKETLKFEFTDTLEKSYSLVEFRPSYIPEHGLWIDNSYYSVDKNWGKYSFINHISAKEIGYGQDALFAKPKEIYFNEDSIAVPASLPLPKLFSRIAMQISGEGPEFKQLNLNGKSKWYNVYRNMPSSFSQNFFRFILNMKIEITTASI